MTLGIANDKTVYTHKGNDPIAQLKYHSKIIPQIEPNNSYKYMGIWIAIDGNIEKQIQTIINKTTWLSNIIKNKAISIDQKVYITNACIISSIAYSMQVLHSQNQQ